MRVQIRIEGIERTILAIILVLTVNGNLPGQSPGSPLHPVELRCEYLVNPLGIDTPRPRFQWVLDWQPGERGRRQTAYQILVAATEASLRTGKGDLWDSGRTESRQTGRVPYGGKSLPSP